MKPGSKRAAFVGTAIVLAGWVLAVLGFATAEHERALIPDGLRVGVRVFGFIVLMTGATVMVYATLGGPTLLMVFGVALNLAHQAGLLKQEVTGVFGAGLILLGALWGSRRARTLAD